MTNENGNVEFGVKELFLEIREDIRAIDTRLSLKADQSELESLANKLQEHVSQNGSGHQTLTAEMAAANKESADHEVRLRKLERVAWAAFGTSTIALITLIIRAIDIWSHTPTP